MTAPCICVPCRQPEHRNAVHAVTSRSPDRRNRLRASRPRTRDNRPASFGPRRQGLALLPKITGMFAASLAFMRVVERNKSSLADRGRHRDLTAREHARGPKADRAREGHRAARAARSRTATRSPSSRSPFRTCRSSPRSPRRSWARTDSRTCHPGISSPSPFGDRFDATRRAVSCPRSGSRAPGTPASCSSHASRSLRTGRREPHASPSKPQGSGGTDDNRRDAERSGHE